MSPEIEPYVIVIDFTRDAMWGKVGPFQNWEAAETWSTGFREIANGKNPNVTAIAGNALEKIEQTIGTLNYLPSANFERILSHMAVKSLFSV